MELFLLYVWLKLDSIHDLMVPLISISVVGGILSLVATTVVLPDLEDNNTARKIHNAGKLWIKRFVLSIIGGVLFTLFVPTSKQMAYLVGGYVALKLVDSPETQKIVAILRNKANEYLDAELAPKEKAK